MRQRSPDLKLRLANFILYLLTVIFVHYLLSNASVSASVTLSLSLKAGCIGWLHAVLLYQNKSRPTQVQSGAHRIAQH